jgi:hypothetical protein
MTTKTLDQLEADAQAGNASTRPHSRRHRQRGNVPESSDSSASTHTTADWLTPTTRPGSTKTCVTPSAHSTRRLPTAPSVKRGSAQGGAATSRPLSSEAASAANRIGDVQRIAVPPVNSAAFEELGRSVDRMSPRRDGFAPPASAGLSTPVRASRRTTRQAETTVHRVAGRRQVGRQVRRQVCRVRGTDPGALGASPSPRVCFTRTGPHSACLAGSVVTSHHAGFASAAPEASARRFPLRAPRVFPGSWQPRQPRHLEQAAPESPRVGWCERDTGVNVDAEGYRRLDSRAGARSTSWPAGARVARPVRPYVTASGGHTVPSSRSTRSTSARRQRCTGPAVAAN